MAGEAASWHLLHTAQHVAELGLPATWSLSSQIRNHMSIKQGVLTTAFFHEVKAKIVVEPGILLWLQKHSASPSGKTPGFCFHWAILGVFCGSVSQIKAQDTERAPLPPCLGDGRSWLME